MACTAAVSAVCAIAAATPAGAQAPAGTVIATGVEQLPAVDGETGRIAFATGARGVVRVVDPAAGTARDTDVGGACTVNDAWPLVQAAAAGAVLLRCERRVVSRSWDGSEIVDYVPLSRILDETDWTVKVPAVVERGRGSVTGLVKAGIIVHYDEDKGPDWEQLLDWRTGAVSSWSGPSCSSLRVEPRPGIRELPPVLERCDGSDRTPLPMAPGTTPDVAHGIASWAVRGLENTMPLTAYLPDCRLLLRWEIGAIDVVDHLPGALLISATDHGGGPLTLTRVPLDGACERIAARWSLRASARGRTVTATIRSASASDAKTAAAVSLLPQAGPAARLRLGVRHQVRLRTAAPAGAVRWRVAGRAWRRASGHGRDWTLRAGAALRRARTIEVRTRLASGDELSHTLLLTPTGRR